MRPRRLRVAVVASHPIQYQAPWFRNLSSAVDLDVYFCHRQDASGQAAAGYGVPFEWDIPLLEGYRYHWLNNRSTAPNVLAYGGCDTPEIGDLLSGARFDACIVNGWYLKSYVQAIRAARKHGVKVFVRGDSQLRTARSRTKSLLKWLPYRVLLNLVDAHLYVGQRNREYLQHYGVPDRKLFLVPHFVDNAFFRRAAERAKAEGQAAALRRRFRIPPEATVALFVGRLVEQKRVHDLIRAVARVQAETDSPVHALIVGAGPLSEALQSLANDVGAPVHFAGFHNQSELPAVYAAADVLVLPSDGRETWGLVVNEAMSCGLPAIVSDAVGCGPDLVVEGVTGRSFPAGDTRQLAHALTATAADLKARKPEISQAISSQIAHYTCSVAVDATVHALSVVVGGREEE